MAELLDVLDEDGRVVDHLPRERVHREGLWHRCVHVLVHDDAGRLLLQLRSDTKDLYPSTWTSSASGHVDHGETPAAAARRELREELGMDAAPRRELAFRATHRYRDLADREEATVFSLITDAVPRPDEHEVAGLRWMEHEAVDAWVEAEPEAFDPGFLDVLERYRWRC